MNLKFYKCDICGKIITVLYGDSVPTMCCGEVMKEIIPNRTDGASEKHVPVFHTEGSTVNVKIGSDPHPMTYNHSIIWVGLQTSEGFQFKELTPDDSPEVCFRITEGDSAETVYAFCNLHGLWASDKES